MDTMTAETAETATTTHTAEALPAVDKVLADMMERHDAEELALMKSSDYCHKALRAHLDQRQVERASIAPEVGMGATVRGYSDRTACTVVEVSKSGREIVLREDTATLLNGVNSGADDSLQFHPGGFCGTMTGVQRYAYTANPQGSTHRFSKRTRKDGTAVWCRVGERSGHSSGLVLGRRNHHYDYNF